MRLVLCMLATLAAVGGGPVSGAPAPGWSGSRHAQPAAYSWLDQQTPSDTYTMTVVRGLRPGQVIKAIGIVRQTLSDRSPGLAEDYYYDHLGSDYSGPIVMQVERLGHAVVVYGPSQVVSDQIIARLSAHGVAASFFTDVEYDTYVTVAQRGRVVRQFDAGFKPPTKGALPAEQGLDWGAKHQNIWATAWAFEERLTLTHVSERWFDGDHPTFVFRGTAQRLTPPGS